VHETCAVRHVPRTTGTRNVLLELPLVSMKLHHTRSTDDTVSKSEVYIMSVVGIERELAMEAFRTAHQQTLIPATGAARHVQAPGGRPAGSGRRRGVQTKLVPSREDGSALKYFPMGPSEGVKGSLSPRV